MDSCLNLIDTWSQVYKCLLFSEIIKMHIWNPILHPTNFHHLLGSKNAGYWPKVTGGIKGLKGLFALYRDILVKNICCRVSKLLNDILFDNK